MHFTWRPHALVHHPQFTGSHPRPYQGSLPYLQCHALYTGPRLPAAITDLSVRTDITGARLAVGGGVGHGKRRLLHCSSSRSGNLHRQLPIAEGGPSLHAHRCRVRKSYAVAQCNHHYNHCAAQKGELEKSWLSPKTSIFIQKRHPYTGI